MARNDLGRLLDNLDRFATAAFNQAPTAAAETTVTDLQDLGPVWSGQFSNSWQIATADIVASGDGQIGWPRKIDVPLLSGRKLLLKPIVRYTISNFASGKDGPYALKALDLEEGNYINPGKPPLKPREFGTRVGGIRGNLTDIGSGPNSRTAPLYWFNTYMQGGRLTRTVKSIFDEALQGIL